MRTGTGRGVATIHQTPGCRDGWPRDRPRGARTGAVRIRIAAIIAGMAALTMVAAIAHGLLGARVRAPRATPLSVHLTTSRQCSLPRLPAWTDSPLTTLIFSGDLFRPNTSVITYTRGRGTGLTAWNQGQWLIAMYEPVVATSTAAEQAFAAVHLPGRGAAVWTDPHHWQLNTLWCTHGTAYHLHLTGLGPGAAAVVAQVVAAWNQSHADRFRCQPTQRSLACHAVTSAPG